MMITKNNLKNYNNLIAISNNNYEKFLKELKKEYKINIAYIGYNSGIYGWNFDIEKIYIIDKNNNIIEYFHLINGYRNYSSTNIKELNNLCIDNKIKEIIKKYL